MINHVEAPGKFQTVQAERDLEANWKVDLAKKLYEYLLKICRGEITGTQEGSVQVNGRKVEHLYNLGLHAPDFLSQPKKKKKVDDVDIDLDRSEANSESICYAAVKFELISDFGYLSGIAEN